MKKGLGRPSRGVGSINRRGFLERNIPRRCACVGGESASAVSGANRGGIIERISVRSMCILWGNMIRILAGDEIAAECEIG
jgi:hypothetical protein